MVSSTRNSKYSTNTEDPPIPHAQDYHKRLQHARQKRQQHAKQRRLRKEREPLQREPARAERSLQSLEQVLEELGLMDRISPVNSLECRRLKIQR